MQAECQQNERGVVPVVPEPGDVVRRHELGAPSSGCPPELEARCMPSTASTGWESPSEIPSCHAQQLAMVESALPMLWMLMMTLRHDRPYG